MGRTHSDFEVHAARHQIGAIQDPDRSPTEPRCCLEATLHCLNSSVKRPFVKTEGERTHTPQQRPHTDAWSKIKTKTCPTLRSVISSRAMDTRGSRAVSVCVTL